MIFRNRAYERLLEAEVERLRKENRELINAILPTRGMQPLDRGEPMPEVQPKPRTLGEIRRKMVTESVKNAKLYRWPFWKPKGSANGGEDTRVS